MILLNRMQKYGVEESYIWFKKGNKQVFTVTGAAGTGKTTIVSHLIDRLELTNEQVLFMAYVGKAAMVLSMKGNNAKTIHSSIYTLTRIPIRDDNGQIMMNKGRPITKMGFVKKDNIGPDVRLIVIDEASMVNKDIAEDILSFGIPVVCLGDLNQLPPVFGSSYFLDNPDVVLTEIMRQSKGNRIIDLSQMAIKGIDIPIGKYGDNCIVVDASKITDNTMKNADIILCGKNITRENINYHYRYNILGIDSNFPVIGEKMICRKNNWSESLNKSGISLINGLIGYVDNIDISSYKNNAVKIDFRPDFLDNEFFKDILIDTKYPFMSNREKLNMGYKPFDVTNKLEFGYSITVHLSQGSQYDNVLLFDERMGSKDFYNKWLYTAITRAKKGLIIAKM